MTAKRHTITAALPYANGPVHIGHLAGCYLPADIYTRYLKAKREEVLFICGSDEHGVPITIRAKKEGITYQAAVDKYHHLMQQAFADFGIEFSFYGRTSSPTHHQLSSDFFRKLYDNNGFTEETTEQYYDPEAKHFLADRYITGTCPRCSNQGAYGDQCEKCGSTLNATDLINPKSALSGAVPELKATKNWFLPLDKLQMEFIDGYIDEKKGKWKQHVLGQCQSWLTEGLRPRAMTRDLDWGVKVPIEGADGKVLYVWFDAPLGYFSATKEYVDSRFSATFNGVESVQSAGELGQIEVGKIQLDDWKKWWVKEEGTEQHVVHFIGKDNIVFHCIIFPAMLHAYNQLGMEQYLIADQVPANEFLNLEGQKISTSRNHAVWLHEYLQDFTRKTDELRYYLTAIMPENADSDFTWKGFQLAVNSELVAIIGNFIHRVAVLLHKFYDGKIPSETGMGDREKNLFDNLKQTADTIDSHLQQFRFRDAQSALVDLFRSGNKYFAETEPWHLIKTDPEQTKGVLAAAANYCVSLGILCKPFLPQAAERIKDLFKVANDKYDLTSLGMTNILVTGHAISPAEHLYKNIEDAEIAKQVDKLKTSPVTLFKGEGENNGVDLSQSISGLSKPEIVFEDFSKLDIRIGTIKEVVKVPKADKLLQLTVDVGIDTRTIVSGIAQHFTPEELVGKQVMVLVNLAPRKMKGIESQGMILLAEDENGKLVFVTPENQLNNGAGVS